MIESEILKGLRCFGLYVMSLEFLMHFSNNSWMIAIREIYQYVLQMHCLFSRAAAFLFVWPFWTKLTFLDELNVYVSSLHRFM